MMDNTKQHMWREHAINLALHAQSLDGNGRDALLRAIRRHDPASVALLLEPDREQLLRFLDAEADEFRSLLAGAISYETSDKLAPYVGWYAVTWQGAQFEIAIAPADYAGYVVCIGYDAALLRRFADALTAYTIRPAGRSLYYSMYWRSDPDLDAEIGKVTWDDLVLPPQLQVDLRDAVEGFFKHRDAFAALGFAWRRGDLDDRATRKPAKQWYARRSPPPCRNCRFYTSAIFVKAASPTQSKQSLIAPGSLRRASWHLRISMGWWAKATARCF